DDNEISIEGSTDLAFTEDVEKRFEAYGWHVQHVDDGNDLAAVEAALEKARAVMDRPSLIDVRTIIGYGSPNKAGTEKVHGSPLGEDEVVLTRRNLGWPEDQFFHVPDAVRDHLRAALTTGAGQQADWNDLLARYRAAHPDLARQFDTWTSGTLPDGWDDALPTFEAGEKLASRVASGKVLDALVPALGNLVGGSADLTPSNRTRAKGQEDFQKDHPGGGYFRFGVREHGMAAVCNGIVLHGGLRPYCGTFLIFSDYLRPALRLSALMHAPVIYVFTHDSIGLGEDGPTHQAVEHYAALRAIPNLTFIRPADATETAEAWRAALERTTGPTALALTRQNLAPLDRSASTGGLHRGAYVLRDSDGTPDLILLASGSEMGLIVEAAEVLRGEGVGVRLVSMPSWELFAEQSQAYRDAVLPPGVTKRLAVEAGVTLGWERYVGTEGRILGLDRFGASAPGNVVMEKLGFTVENVLRHARALLA
ncbi:MAG: transketolase, partial [Bacteroidetes bacterium]|nr:transketolase [Bacteroidota bacterium]